LTGQIGPLREGRSGALLERRLGPASACPPAGRGASSSAGCRRSGTAVRR